MSLAEPWCDTTSRSRKCSFQSVFGKSGDFQYSFSVLTHSDVDQTPKDSFSAAEFPHSKKWVDLENLYNKSTGDELSASNYKCETEKVKAIPIVSHRSSVSMEGDANDFRHILSPRSTALLKNHETLSTLKFCLLQN